MGGGGWGGSSQPIGVETCYSSEREIEFTNPFVCWQQGAKNGDAIYNTSQVEILDFPKVFKRHNTRPVETHIFDGELWILLWWRTI